MMATSDNLSQGQFPEITSNEARGNSRPVTSSEFQSLAAAGKKYMDRTENKKSTAGLDANWESIKDRAYDVTREGWGGATINSHTGSFIGDSANDVAAKNAQAQGQGFGTDRYGITVRGRGQHGISVTPGADRATFGKAMDAAREAYPQIANRGGHLGVFHDVDEGRIDIDPVHVVRTPKEVEQVGAYTHAIGGAYHFASGNGYFPPHVPEHLKGK